MKSLHPTIISDQLVRTVNFYEDYFNFVPKVEKDDYVLLECKDNPLSRIAVIDSKSGCIKELGGAGQGLILNFSVENLQSAFEDVYMEGLPIYCDIAKDATGALTFVVRDPNGVLIKVCQAEDVAD